MNLAVTSPVDSNMTLNTKDRRRREELTILELSYKGKSGLEISKELNISTGKVSNILGRISKQARTDIEQGLFLHTIPLETKKRLMKLDAMDKKCFEILEQSTDMRVQLLAIAQIGANDTKRMEILTSEELISRAISAQRQTLKASEIQRLQKSTDDANNKRIASENESVSTEADQREAV